MKNPITLLLTALIALATNCKDKNTQKNPYEGMNYTEVCAEFDNYAIEQKRIIRLIRKEYIADKLFIAHFNQEQMDWLKYQDSRLRSLYPKDWDNYYRKNYGNAVFNGCKCKELIRMSQTRNQELETYLKGRDVSQAECPIQGNL